MSESVVKPQSKPAQRPLLAVLWFIWMEAMWVAFFILVFSNQLAGLWTTLTHLPAIAQVVIWIAFLPWMLGSWVWLGSWPLWIRVVLDLCFTVGWSIVSIPRRKGSLVGQVRQPSQLPGSDATIKKEV